MPNWCENTVNVFGKSDELKKMIELMETENSRFDFGAVLPMPESLNVIISGGKKIDGEYITLWRKLEDGTEVAITEEEQSKLLDEYGATNWYDWNIQNWGTKWNSGDVSVDEEYEHINYVFDTAWSPPIPVMDELSRRFPSLTFVLRYEEPGMAFWGELEWHEGEMVAVKEGEMDFDEEAEEYSYIEK